MQKISAQLSEIEQQLSGSEIYSDNNKQELQQLLLEKSELDKTHENAETEWLEISEELETM